MIIKFVFNEKHCHICRINKKIDCMKLKRTLCVALLLFVLQFSFAQEKAVKGVVKDEQGFPLPGVTILVKGEKSKGTQTDFDGNYSISVSQGKTLVFSYVGMKTVEKKVGASSVINVELKTDAQELSAVVVTGITTTDKRLFTGASDRLSAKDIKLDGLPDVSRALEGRSAGVSVQNVSGTFGAAPKIRVRGATSIYGSSKPLWVVDGVPLEDVVEVSADDLASGDVTTLISSAIAGLNPDDIESFEILKDGSATSIYGARAMGGVIVVTTKRGMDGVSTFNYTGEYTYRVIPTYSEFNIMNSQEQMSVYEEMRKSGWLNFAEIASASEGGVYNKLYNLIGEYRDNGKFTVLNTPEGMAAYLRAAEQRNTNWFGELFQSNIMQSHAISMSSGTKKSDYYASVSALVDPGWTLSSNVNRYTANFKSNFRLTDNLTFTALSSGSYRQQKAPGTLSQQEDIVRGGVSRDFDINPFSFALNTSRTLDPDEFYTRNYAPFNIKKELRNNYIDLNVVDMKFQSEVKWKVTPQIEAVALGALKYQTTSQEHTVTESSNQAEAYRAMQTTTVRDNNHFLYTDPDDPYALPVSVLPQGGIYDRIDYRMLGYDLRGTVSYKNVFNDIHTLNVYLGTELNAADRRKSGSTGWGMQYDLGEKPFYVYEMFKKGIEDNIAYYELSNTKSRSAAFFSNLTYSWKRRYTVNGTFRYEGTNKLGRSRTSRWLPTWNISGAWNAHEEDFFTVLDPVMSNFTLKASYSLTADRGPSFVSNSLVDVRSYTPWRPSSSVKESSLAIASLENSELTYEKKHELNIGTEIGFLNNRVNVSADWYTRDNFDLIGRISTQGLGGEIEKYGNVASMKSSGFELSLSTTNIKTPDFSWSTSFVYSHSENTITNFKSKVSVYRLITGNGFTLEGYPVRSIFSVPFKGLNDEGLPTFLNQDNETTVTDVYFQEREKVGFLKYSGNADPTDVGSLGNVFTYKGLKLNVLVTYSFGNVVRLDPVFSYRYSDLSALPKEFKNRWIMPGDEKRTDIPAIATRRQQQRYGSSDLINAYSSYNYSDARVAKGDFVRLKEVSLSYDFDSDIVKRLKLKNLSLKLQATNPWLIYSDSKLNGQDPEFTNSGGVAIPVPKQITFSIRAGI